MQNSPNSYTNILLSKYVNNLCIYCAKNMKGWSHKLEIRCVEQSDPALKKLASSKMHKLRSWQAHILTNWQAARLTRWQDYGMTGWQFIMTWSLKSKALTDRVSEWLKWVKSRDASTSNKLTSLEAKLVSKLCRVTESPTDRGEIYNCWRS